MFKTLQHQIDNLTYEFLILKKTTCFPLYIVKE